MTTRGQKNITVLTTIDIGNKHFRGNDMVCAVPHKFGGESE